VSVPTALIGAVDTNAPGYDLVLLAHVLVAVVALVAVLVSGGFAFALRQALAAGGTVPEPVVRYYRPGVNWAGRILFLVPVFGVALLAMSGGAWSFADTWVSMGTAGWAVVAIAAEAVLWPTERRLQRVVAARTGAVHGPSGEAPADGVTATSREHGGVGDPSSLCLQAGLLATGLGALLVAVAVLMAAKP